MLNLHRPTSSSSSTMNFPWISPCLLVHVLLLLLIITCNCFTYIAEERTWAYSKHISHDRYPATLMMCRSILQKTLLPLLLCDLAIGCLPRICLCKNLFTNTLPSNGCTCKSIYWVWLLNNETDIIFYWEFKAVALGTYAALQVFLPYLEASLKIILRKPLQQLFFLSFQWIF
jgi:hypothetical protein